MTTAIRTSRSPRRAELRRNVGLLFSLGHRIIFARYRDTILGVAWSVIYPLIMLAVYAFVFSQVFQARWDVESGDQISFAIVLFSGLLLFNFFSETLNGATGVVGANAQLIKRTSVHSLILPLSVVVSALMTMGLSLIPFVIGYAVTVGVPPATAPLFFVIFIPQVVLCAGLALLLAALSVYIRDLQPMTMVFTTVVLFLSPIFYPESLIPPQFRGLVLYSPIGVPLTESKKVLFWGQLPHLGNLTVYTTVAVVLLYIGAKVFRKAQRGFADVL